MIRQSFTYFRIEVPYLGTIFNKYMPLTDNIKDACDKLKGTFVSLVHGGVIHEQGLHTLSCLKIYRCIALPKQRPSTVVKTGAI